MIIMLIIIVVIMKIFHFLWVYERFMKLSGSVRCVCLCVCGCECVEHPILQWRTAGHRSLVHTVRSGKKEDTGGWGGGGKGGQTGRQEDTEMEG